MDYLERIMIIEFLKSYVNNFLMKSDLGGTMEMQFVCLECSEDHHEVCIERNANREVPDCDCQHKRVVK